MQRFSYASYQAAVNWTYINTPVNCAYHKTITTAEVWLLSIFDNFLLVT